MTNVIADSSVRYDWSLGQPVVTEDTTDATSSYYGWSMGQPVVMEYYYTAPAPPSGAGLWNMLIKENVNVIGDLNVF